MRKLLTLENLTFLGIVLGIAVGLSTDYYEPFKLVGDVFLKLLKMIALPLIFFSIFASILNIGDIKSFANLGMKAVIYYIATTFISVLTGLLVVNLIMNSFTLELQIAKQGELENVARFTLQSLIDSIVPSNIVESFLQFNVLQVILLSIIFALSTLNLSSQSRKFMESMVYSLDELIMRTARWIIYLTPVGVFGLVAYVVSHYGIETIKSLWIYALAVVVGLSIHAFFNLPMLAYLLAKINPYRYMLAVREAFLVAFSTSSSSATLPVSMKMAVDKGNVRKEVAGFVLPFGATVNMDGTALYEAIAAIFIAHVYGIELTLSQQFIIFLTSTLAAIGAASIPSAGLVTMTLVFSSVGLPLEGIAIILAIDRFLDMLRTTVNVWGDLVGAKILDRFV